MDKARWKKRKRHTSPLVLNPPGLKKRSLKTILKTKDSKSLEEKQGLQNNDLQKAMTCVSLRTAGLQVALGTSLLTGLAIHFIARINHEYKGFFMRCSAGRPGHSSAFNLGQFWQSWQFWQSRSASDN
jgi:hypothetical protein